MWHDREPPIAPSLSFPPVNSTPLLHPVPCTSSPPNLVPTHPLYISLVTCLCLLIRHPAPMLTIISLLLSQNPVFNPLCHSPNHIWNHRTENVPYPYQVLWVLHVRRDIKTAGKQRTMPPFSSLRFNLPFWSTWTDGVSKITYAMKDNLCAPSSKVFFYAFCPALASPYWGLMQVFRGLKLTQFGGGASFKKKSTICKYKIKLWKEPLHWAALEFKLHLLLVKSTLPTVVYLHIL